MRGHAEGFAENMLAKATQDKPVDMDAAWAAFSGVLTSETIEAAEWGSVVKKKPGPRSVNVFDIGAFQGASATAPPTPVQHAVFQLTEAKVNAQPTPDGYEPPADQSDLLIPWATAAGMAAGKKRKRTRDMDGDDDSDAASADDDDEEENDDDGSSQ